MASAFNPYLKWLGIPLKDQPPHHYRLLGVETFEADTDIIQRAADRQMTYLRSLQSGEQVEHAQRLLNELSAAKVCLLDATKKQQYDQALRIAEQESNLQPQAPPPIAGAVQESGIHSAIPLPPQHPVSASGSNISSASGVRQAARPIAVVQPLRPTPAAVAPVSVATTPTATAQPSMASRAASRRSSSPLPLILIAGGVAAVLLIGGLFILNRLSSDLPQPVAQGEPLDPVDGNDAVATDADGTAKTAGSPTGQVAGNPRETNETPAVEDPADVPSDETTDAGNDVAPTSKLAHLAIEAALITGTLAADKPVLLDRDYTFDEVAPELQDLQFSRWEFGPVPAFKFSVMDAGTIYLILPPRDYDQALPSIKLAGWRKTDLTCNVRVEGGKVLPCLVFEREKESTSGSISAGTAIWPMIAAATLEKKTRILGDIVKNPAAGGTDTDNGKSPTGSTNPTATTVVQAAKLRIPTSDAQQPIRTRVEEVFEVGSLTTLEEKSHVARRMLATGRQPSENATERFVLLATASRMAADAGDLTTALDSVSEIEKHYEAQGSAMRLYLVRQFAKSRVPKNLKLQQLAAIVPVLDQGLADDQYDAVDETVTELFDNGVSHRVMGERRRVAREKKVGYRRVLVAKQTLATSPDDGEANTVVGKHLAFDKLNWDDALPHLAQCDVAEIRKVAKADLGNPESSKDQLEIAGGWYALVDQEEAEQAQGALLTRAEDWYRKAASEVQGLEAAHTQKRLDDIQQQLVDLGWVDLPKDATITAASGSSCVIYFNGEQIIASYGDRPGTANVTLKRGDLLMVHAQKSTFESSTQSKGFACVITFAGSTPPSVAGKSDGWNAYVPSDTLEWYKPEKVARTLKYVVSPNAGHTMLNQQTGIAARSIWHAVGNTGDAYFYYRVQ